MKLFLGKENRFSYSTQFDKIGPWDTASADYHGTMLAPDMSSQATEYSGNNTQWDVLLTDYNVFSIPLHENKAYIVSFYAKAANDETATRVSSYMYDGVQKWWGATVNFEDGTVTTWVSAPGAEHLGVVALDYHYVRNGWYRFWAIHDVRDTPFAGPLNNCEMRFYINPNGSPAQHMGVGFWGAQLEKTNRRNYPTPLRNTDGTAIVGIDYTMIDFTQLPSNLSEIEHDIYDSVKDSQGNVLRRNAYTDQNVHRLVWDRINYRTHGHMIYVMKESVRDKLKNDCILEYPGTLKRHVRSADIRVVDFKFEYLPAPNMAKIELLYVIENVYYY